MIDGEKRTYLEPKVGDAAREHAIRRELPCHHVPVGAEGGGADVEARADLALSRAVAQLRQSVQQIQRRFMSDEAASGRMGGHWG